MLPWVWEEWGLGFKEQESSAGISHTHTHTPLVQVQSGPVVLGVSGAEAGGGDIGERGCYYLVAGGCMDRGAKS